jgi:hypothetical protein
LTKGDHHNVEYALAEPREKLLCLFHLTLLRFLSFLVLIFTCDIAPSLILILREQSSEEFSSIFYSHPNLIHSNSFIRPNLCCLEQVVQVLGSCFVAEGHAGRKHLQQIYLYEIPKLPLIKLRRYSVSKDEGSNRLKDGITF